MNPAKPDCEGQPTSASSFWRRAQLIMGLGEDHHVWWNLLRELDMLEYDCLLAALAVLSGATVVLLAAGLGILSAWVLPRSGIGPKARYTGRFWPAIRARQRG